MGILFEVLRIAIVKVKSSNDAEDKYSPPSAYVYSNNTQVPAVNYSLEVSLLLHSLKNMSDV